MCKWKDNDNKTTVDNNINKNKFVVHVIGHVVDN